MIQTLKVKDFALIEDITINFESGLTVLTGETGSGKSIILEALNLLFAKRSDQEMIRHGKDKAVVTGTFILNESLQQIFELPQQITIIREIEKNGRHKVFLNDNQITLTYLKTITEKIGSIHSQNDTFLLLDNSLYLNFIDEIDKENINKILTSYLIKRSEYLDNLKHLEHLKQKKAEDIEQKEFYEYQLNEIKSLNLELNELENLEQNYEKLKHFDKISNNLNNSYQIINNNQFDNLYDAAKLLEAIKEFDLDYQSQSEKIFNLYYELDEIKSTISNKIYELDFDENEFNLIQERIYELKKLEEKYNKSINELINYQEELEEKINLIANYDDYIKKYQQKVDNLYLQAYNEAYNLSNLRQKLAKKLEKQIIEQLKDLDLDKAKFQIIFTQLTKEEKTLLENGIDSIEFYISLNEGEPLKPLHKVASGGERARFMFALKSIYAKQNNLSLLVLDEIDIGISGKTAAKMANKMVELSKDLQLLVITHLPQVAAKADHHYGISKQLKNERMITNITKLDETKRIEMIALMLSDESLSHYAIEQAKMLLKK